MLGLLLSSLSFGVPVEMNHQGRLLDTNGAGMTGTSVMTFKIYDAETGGNIVWTTATAVTFDDGYYSIPLGADGTLDSDVLGQYPLWMELTIDANPPMEPRHKMGSVPYSVISEVAESVEGGPVDASELSINGTVIIDADGNWVGPEIAGSGSTGGSTSGGSTTGGSSTGGTSGGTNSPVYWSDILGRPLGLDDGDDFLTEGAVETYITNGFINLATGSRMGGFDLLTTNSTITPQWSNIQGIPSDIADGDQDTQLTESQVENYVINGAINLGSGSQVGGSTILTHNDTISWSSLSNVPTGLDDGDDDTLSGLNCGSGDVVSWNGTAFECLTLSAGVGNGSILDLGSGSTINGSPIVTQSDLSNPNWSDIVDVPAGFLDGVDDDSFADISCGSGETISFDGSAWVCVSSTIDFGDIANVPADLVDGDDDTLGVLSCSDGQVAVYSAADSGWVCGDVESGSSGSLGSRIGESDGGFEYASLDTPETFPDNNTYGFVSARAVGDEITVSTFSIDLEITHADMAEVKVVLTSPEGTAITVYDGNHPGQSNFSGNLGWDNEMAEGNLYSFYGEDPRGVWTLAVTDTLGTGDGGNGDNGTLEGWTLRLNEDWDGEIFVGDNITVQETMVVRGESRVEYGGDLVFTNTDGEETIRIDGETGSIQGLVEPVYRTARWSTYASNIGWPMGNSSDMFGGIHPSNWNGTYAHQLSDDKGVLSTFFSKRGYISSNGNVNVISETVYNGVQCTNGEFAGVLFRVRNSTENNIDWTPNWHYSSYGGCSQYASLALNGSLEWSNTSNTISTASHTLSIPANRTSTVIFISAGSYSTYSYLALAFYNGSLTLPEGLEFIDDLDEAQDGWDY